VGSFSFQQSKVLTSGEGGAVTCNDESYYKIMHALKQVGWTPDMTPANHYGHNYRITEMQAVLLRGGLSRLKDQNRIREENAAYITEALRKEGGPLRVARKDPRITRQAYYALTLVYDSKKAENLTRQAYIKALTAEGCPVGGTYAPVYANPLMNLYDKTSPVLYRDQNKIQDYRSLKLPNVEKAVNETAVILSHTHLLGERAYIDELISAVRKVNNNLKLVRNAWEKHKTK